MKKEVEIEIVDLGVASIETKGPPGVDTESQGFQRQSGISDVD